MINPEYLKLDEINRLRAIANKNAKKELGRNWHLKPGALVWAKPPQWLRKTYSIVETRFVPEYAIFTKKNKYGTSRHEVPGSQIATDPDRFNKNFVVYPASEKTGEVKIKQRKTWHVAAPRFWPGGKLPEGFTVIEPVPLIHTIKAALIGREAWLDEQRKLARQRGPDFRYDEAA